MKKIDIACIIDDDPLFVFGAKRLMDVSEFSKNIMVFSNGAEAIEVLRPMMSSSSSKLPDVILLDLNMPIMDGWEFLDEFIKIPCHKEILIYIVTSSIDPNDINKAKTYQDKVKNYLLKPIDKNQLDAILESFEEDKG
tara:strand:- start:309 stop:722 length:414 start_codon:yes stop_codon:yes gene_type:complete